MTQVSKEENILSKYTERLASQQSIAIDNFIKSYVPEWQVKIMVILPFTKKLFGWSLETKIGFMGNKELILKNFGKFVANLKIIVKSKEN